MISFNIYLFIGSILYIYFAKLAALYLASYLCRNKPTVYSFPELQKTDRQDQCCWRGILTIYLIMPFLYLLIKG